MSRYFYLLDLNHMPYPVSDVLAWARAMAVSQRTIALTRVGGYRVSTVFLGIDHRLGGGPPLLFETMVMGGPLDQKQERYSTWNEAVEGHAKWVKKVGEVNGKN